MGVLGDAAFDLSNADLIAVPGINNCLQEAARRIVKAVGLAAQTSGGIRFQSENLIRSLRVEQERGSLVLKPVAGSVVFGARKEEVRGWWDRQSWNMEGIKRHAAGRCVRIPGD